MRAGFEEVEIYQEYGIDNLLGIGAKYDKPSITFRCPTNNLITGIAGAVRGDTGKGWIANLQFQCSSKFKMYGPTYGTHCAGH